MSMYRNIFSKKCFRIKWGFYYRNVNDSILFRIAKQTQRFKIQVLYQLYHWNHGGLDGVTRAKYVIVHVRQRFCSISFLDPPPLEVRSYRLTPFRPCVRASVRPGNFQKIGSLIFSDFWHDFRFLWILKSD